MNDIYIIAEAGVNHNGSLAMAKELIDLASESGADAIKFQTFKADKIISKHTPKADYQLQTTDRSESQYEMLKKLELDEQAHLSLMEHCRKRAIEFLSTPFDLESVELLAYKLDLPRLKLPSGEITNAPLLLKAASSGKPIILSTGMSALEEIETALGVLAFGYIGSKERPTLQAFKKAYVSVDGETLLREKVVLLHCTTEYPAPFHDVNLRAMDTLKETFHLPVGFSDHTPGIAVAVAAAARGASVIEKHFTLNKNLPGPDHKASLEPDELKAMICSIREVESALGSPVKKPALSELKNREIARKSLVTAKEIRKGEFFSEENLTVKRPGTGIAPIRYWEWLGKTAERDYKEDELVTE